MESLALSFFPFPYVRDGKRFDGTLFGWARRCSSCDRQCEKAQGQSVNLCSYGVNYCRFDNNMLVAGIVIRDFSQSTPARRKVLRNEGPGPSMAQVVAAKARYEGLDTAAQEEVRVRKEAVLAEYVESAAYKQELLEMLKPQLKETLFQVHDYRQLATRILQNMNVILEKRFPHVPIEEKLRSADHEEVAIYWATRLMEEKLQTILFLREPEALDDLSKDVKFRLHGCVLKYLRIYQRSFDEKGIKIEVTGESYGEMIANPVAIGVIPQTLLDNALKYSPRNGLVRLRFEESRETLSFTVGSYGPTIRSGEERRIFELFYRGEDAKRLEAEGSGFGLYLAQVIATKNGGVIRVKQDKKDRVVGSVWTEFTVSFPVKLGRYG